MAAFFVTWYIGGLGGWAQPESARLNLRLHNLGENNPNFGTQWTEERRTKFLTTWADKKEKGETSRSAESMKNTWAANARKYKIISDKGDVYITDDITQFAIDYNLSLTALRAGLKITGPITGKNKTKKLLGWEIKYADDKWN